MGGASSSMRFLLITVASFLAVALCNATKLHCVAHAKNPQPPTGASDVLRSQIQSSLSLSGRYPNPHINYTKAFEAHDWQSFADVVGTQDFSVTPINVSLMGRSAIKQSYNIVLSEKTRGARRESPYGVYIHLDYGLGDNDFGSVHPATEVPPIIRVDDGDWHTIPGTHLRDGLSRCLEAAEDGATPAAAMSNGPCMDRSIKCSTLGRLSPADKKAKCSVEKVRDYCCKTCSSPLAAALHPQGANPCNNHNTSNACNGVADKRCTWSHFGCVCTHPDCQ